MGPRFKADWWEKRDVAPQLRSPKRNVPGLDEASFNRIPDTSDLLTVDLLVEVAKTTASRKQGATRVLPESQGVSEIR